MSNKIGLSPQLRKELDAIWSALGEDIVVNIMSADDAIEPTAAVWSKIVTFQLEDSNGLLLNGLNGVIDATVGNTSTAGTAAVDDATPAVANGVGQVTLSGDAAAWLDTETATVLFDGTIAGKALVGKTFTRTITA